MLAAACYEVRPWQALPSVGNVEELKPWISEMQDGTCVRVTDGVGTDCYVVRGQTLHSWALPYDVRSALGVLDVKVWATDPRRWWLSTQDGVRLFGIASYEADRTAVGSELRCAVTLAILECVQRQFRSSTRTQEALALDLYTAVQGWYATPDAARAQEVQEATKRLDPGVNFTQMPEVGEALRCVGLSVEAPRYAERAAQLLVYGVIREAVSEQSWSPEKVVLYQRELQRTIAAIASQYIRLSTVLLGLIQ